MNDTIVFNEEEFDRLLKESENNPNLKINLGHNGVKLKKKYVYGLPLKPKKIHLNSINIIVRIKNHDEVRKKLKIVFGNIIRFCDKYSLTASNVYSSLNGNQEIISYDFIDILLQLKIPVELQFYKKKLKNKEREEII